MSQDYMFTEEGRRFARDLVEKLAGLEYAAVWRWSKASEFYVFTVDQGDVRLYYGVTALVIDRARDRQHLLDMTAADIDGKFEARHAAP
jgi:hypothetical protein